MNALRALLADRKRSQQGSVLSATLIIVAFLATIAGALMTALSTNFLLSNALVNRVSTEATVNSAAELAFSQLQGTSLISACPSPSSVTLNGQTAAVSVASCFPIVDRISRAFNPIASSAPFTVDGSRVSVPGLDEYLVGDSGGTVFAYRFGQAAAAWSRSLGGSVTGPPTAMPEVTENGISTLVPLSNATAPPASGPACGSSCVALLFQPSPGSAPQPQPLCYMITAARVTSAPGPGKAFPGLVFVGDSSGRLYAESATESGNCLEQDRAQPAYGPIVAGPIVMQNNSRDEIFVVSNPGPNQQGQPSLMLHYTCCSNGRLVYQQSDDIVLTAGGAVGLALEQSTAPTRLAITFASGAVQLLRIDSTFDPHKDATGSVGSAVGNDPYWCHCPGGSNLIGIGGSNGTLYVLDSNLNLYASYAGGSAIRTTPYADGGGDWFFGADDGRLYEVQKRTAAPAMALAVSYGTAQSIRSSLVAGPCQVNTNIYICIYFGALDGKAYLVSLDARDAVLTTCISTTPPACSPGVNPRLWTHVEVGVMGNPQTVHVQGWSYYSP